MKIIKIPRNKYLPFHHHYLHVIQSLQYRLYRLMLYNIRYIYYISRKELQCNVYCIGAVEYPGCCCNKKYT